MCYSPWGRKKWDVTEHLNNNKKSRKLPSAIIFQKSSRSWMALLCLLSPTPTTLLVPHLGCCMSPSPCGSLSAQCGLSDPGCSCPSLPSCPQGALARLSRWPCQSPGSQGGRGPEAGGRNKDGQGHPGADGPTATQWADPQTGGIRA